MPASLSYLKVVACTSGFKVPTCEVVLKLIQYLHVNLWRELKNVVLYNSLLLPIYCNMID